MDYSEILENLEYIEKSHKIHHLMKSKKIYKNLNIIIF